MIGEKVMIQGRIEAAPRSALTLNSGPNPTNQASDWRAEMDSTRRCSIDGCVNHSRSGKSPYCEMHYYRIRRSGSPGEGEKRIKLSPTGDMWGFVVPTGFCWEWHGHLNKTGYGRTSISGKHKLAHRAVYEELVGPIGEGLHLDHLCRNTACVNPDHLEPVTPAENNRRGRMGVLFPRDTSELCKYGHKRLRFTGKSWRCLECHLIETHVRRGKDCSIGSPCHRRAA